MNETRSTERRVRAREHGRGRIRIVTRRIAAASVAGCGVFAGLAATHGKPVSVSTPVTTAPTKKPTTTATVAPTTTTTPSPTVTVTPTQSAPVTVSGGS